MNRLFRQRGMGPRDHAALALFALAYLAAMALVLWPGLVTADRAPPGVQTHQLP